MHEPHFEPGSQHVPVACGVVPGTPAGQRGEIQYFVERLADGALKSHAVAVSATLDGLGAVSHRVGPPYDQMRFRVSAENGQARLEITWTGPAGDQRAAIADELRASVLHHREILEAAAGLAG